MAEYTRGPWRADDNGDGTSCITAGRGCDVADTRAGVDEPANARLIAAAPALFANLRLAVHHLETGIPVTHDALANMNAAIARATGTT